MASPIGGRPIEGKLISSEGLCEARLRRQWIGMSERRITAAMLEVRDRADGFAGLPPREARPDHFLSAFQEAEPYLHLPIHGLQTGYVVGQADASQRLAVRVPADCLADPSPAMRTARDFAGAGEAA